MKHVNISCLSKKNNDSFNNENNNNDDSNDNIDYSKMNNSTSSNNQENSGGKAGKRSTNTVYNDIMKKEEIRISKMKMLQDMAQVCSCVRYAFMYIYACIL